MHKDELIRMLTLAAAREDESYHMYKSIAEESGDSELAVIFNRLAKEEMEHRETIKKRLEIFKKYT